MRPEEEAGSLIASATVVKSTHLLLQARDNELALAVDSPVGNFSPFIFLPPALLDMLATSTMYVGLNLTYASSFQMLRGLPLSCGKRTLY